MSEKGPAYCEYLRVNENNTQACGYHPADDNSIQIPSGALERMIGWLLPICLPAKRVVSPLMIDLIRGREFPLEQQPQAIAEAQARECNCYTPYTPQVPEEVKDEAIDITQSFSPFAETVDFAIVRPGESIKVFKGLSSVDIFTAFAADRAKQQTGISKVRKYTLPSERILSDTRKHGFNGSFQNIKATIVTNAFNTESELGNSSSTRDLLRYLVELDMHSGGRGKIGSYVAAIGIVSLGESNNRPMVGITFRNLSGKKGLEDIDALLATSKGVWEEAQRTSLRRVVSAGLPSLGKRR